MCKNCPKQIHCTNYTRALEYIFDLSAENKNGRRIMCGAFNNYKYYMPDLVALGICLELLSIDKVIKTLPYTNYERILNDLNNDYKYNLNDSFKKEYMCKFID